MFLGESLGTFRAQKHPEVVPKKSRLVAGQNPPFHSVSPRVSALARGRSNAIPSRRTRPDGGRRGNTSE